MPAVFTSAWNLPVELLVDMEVGLADFTKNDNYLGPNGTHCPGAMLVLFELCQGV